MAKWILILSCLACPLLADDSIQFDEYNESIAAAKQDGKPLYIFLTSRNCPPCVVVYETILRPLARNNRFDKCYLVKVDVGEMPATAEHLFEITKAKHTPQFLAVVYGDSPSTYFLRGAITLDRVTSLVDRVGLDLAALKEKR